LVNIQSYVAYDVDVLGGLPEVVGISETLPFKSDSFDSILCTQVLEHVPRPWLTMAEIFRVLKPNGRLLLSVPQSWRLHEQPHDFYRYTRFGLQSLCDQANLSIEKILPQGGAWALIGQNINNTIWRSSIKKFTVSWYFRVVISILSNTIFGSLDKLDQDTDDTLNYVVLARKLV
jgi:SAM-dependent methyltransferase